MAYSTSVGPYLVSPAVAGGANAGSSVTGVNIWGYRSSDPLATVISTGYFSDGDKRGMRPADVLHFIRVSTAAAPVAFHSICVSSVSTNGATAAVINSCSS